MKLCFNLEIERYLNCFHSQDVGSVNKKISSKIEGEWNLTDVAIDYRCSIDLLAKNQNFLFDLSLNKHIVI